MGETVEEAKEVTGLTQGQQMEHAANVVPSVKRDSILPTGKTCKNCSNKDHFAHVCGPHKGRCLLASNLIMVYPSGN